MDFTNVCASLKKHKFNVEVFDTAADASDWLDRNIDRKTVGAGVSMTIREMGVLDRLRAHNTVYFHLEPPEEMTTEETRRAAALTDVYLTSVNGLAETGELINIDGVGNRAASMLYGHQQIYFIVGRNKVAPDFEQALWRARNIAAPKNAQRMGLRTPCAVLGDRCYDCGSPDRICRGLVVLWEAMKQCEMTVILINEDLGY